MNIKRVDGYEDVRFSQVVLAQHGAYEIDKEPYEAEIVDSDCAVIRGKDSDKYFSLIKEFRFHAPHISRFIDSNGTLILKFLPSQRFNLPLALIQPSQFYVSSRKLEAVRSFIQKAEDIVVPVIRWKGRYISLDAHTRLYVAYERGWKTVHAVLSAVDAWVWKFVAEAEKRGIYQPQDLQVVPHREYEIYWYAFCDKMQQKIFNHTD
ncbi:MAG: hypothetical protein ACTTI3_00295 [Treponema sp.]